MRIYNPSTGVGGSGSVGATGATGPQGIQGPGGGGGAGGLMFYLNQNTSPDSPIIGLPYTAVGGTSVTIKELGRTADAAQTTITTQHLPTGSYEIMAAFVSDLLDPNITSIPAGLWDINFWASSDANQNNQMSVIVKVYKYNGTAATLIATSDAVFIYDPTVVTQYTLNTVIPAGVTLNTSDRIYIELLGRGSSNNYTITLKFGDGTPTHVHTTIPSVSGTGLVKVVDGLPQTPATLLNNSDVAANANIDLTKINVNSLLNYFGMSTTVLDTIPRNTALSNIQLSSGFVYYTIFTPIVNITANTVSLNVAVAAGTPTTFLIGLYSYNEATDTFTRLSKTTNESTLISSTPAVPKTVSLNFDTAQNLVAGSRYAIGMLAVFTGANPNITGATTQAGAPLNNLNPAIAKISGPGNVDVPSSASGLSGSINKFFYRLY